MKRFVNNCGACLLRIPARRALERSAAHVDDATARYSEREDPVLSALRERFPVHEDQKAEVALRADVQL
jgi:hypothetical protein